MDSFASISAAEIGAWSGRVEAAGLLPRLVGRLLLATARPEKFSMPSEEQTRLAGWDGWTDTPQATTFCPAGPSAWELSTDTDVIRKLNEDFKKRSDEPPGGVIPSTVAYVAVTGRALPPGRKQAWVTEQASKGVWRDVRLLDAADLSAWLDIAPSVRAWFAWKLGRPLDHVLTVDEFVDEWKQRVVPPMPAEILALGDQRRLVQRDLLAWLDAPPVDFFELSAPTLEEGSVFSAMAIAKNPSASARALVVEDKATWRRLLASSDPLVLIPAFEGFHRGMVPTPLGHHVVVIGESSPTIKSGGHLDLIPIALVEGTLREAGRAPNDAKGLAMASRGSVSALMRAAGDTEKPRWATRHPRQRLLALLLMGGWVSSMSGDQEIARLLGGDFELLEQLCLELSQGQEQPMRLRPGRWHGEEAWRWVAPDDAWRALRPFVGKAQVGLLGKAVALALGESDPRFELPKEKRYMAAVLGRTRSHSEALRRGLAESLARLKETEAGIGQYVADLLHPAWQAWASLGPLLPLLAEAAPALFLHQLVESIRNPNGICRLFDEETTLGEAPHAHVVRALEVLAWDERHLHQAADALGLFAANDPGGNNANRPAGALAAILHPLFPHSNSRLGDRLAIAERMVRNVPNIAWDVLLSGLETGRGGFILQSARPSFTLAGEERTESVPLSEAQSQYTKYVDLLLGMTDRQPDRCLSLIEAASLHGQTMLGRVLGEVISSEMSSEMRQELWIGLGEQLYFARTRQEDLIEAAINEAWQQLTPSDPLLRSAPAFAVWPKTPELDGQDFSIKNVDQLRATKVDSLWLEGVLPDRLGELIELGDARLVGVALADSRHSDEVEALLRADVKCMGIDAMCGFVGARARTKGTEWLCDVLRVLSVGGGDELSADVAARVGGGAEVWELVESLSAHARERFWTQARWLSIDSRESLERAIETYVEFERSDAALELAAHTEEYLAGDTALRLLIHLSTGFRGGDTMSNYYIGKLFERVDADEVGQIGELFQVELAFLNLLKNESRGPKHLFAGLEGDPNFFVRLLEMVYQPQGTAAESKSEPTEREQTAARNAHTILNAWTTTPGCRLTEPKDREAELLRWCETALDASVLSDREEVAAYEVGRMLARAGTAEDGMWPCSPARTLLESGRWSKISSGLYTAERNSRGVVTKELAEGGGQESELAEKYKTQANGVRDRYPVTARLLSELSESYAAEAAREDVRAATERVSSWGSPRNFPSKDEFKRATSDIYDEFASANLIVWSKSPLQLDLAAQPPSEGAAVAFGWQSGAHVVAGWLSRTDRKRLESLHSKTLEVWYFDGVEELRPLVEDSWEWSSIVPGQIAGYWFEQAEVPSEAPAHSPTGALLPQVSEGDTKALILVEEGGSWAPLSRLGFMSSVHGGRLAKGESIHFVAFGDQREVFEVTSLEEIEWSEIEECFGAAAAERASSDSPAATVRIRKRT